jgi:hypothetical protein
MANTGEVEKDWQANWDRDWEFVQQLLPEQWQSKARELGALRRGRVITNAQTLLRLMLIHLTDGCALRTTAAKASAGGLVNVSDVAIFKRLRNCGDWFEWMCQQLRSSWPPAPLQPQLGSCWTNRRIRMLDGTMVSEPGATGSQWRLHYSIDFPSLQADEVIVSPSTDGETLRRFTFKACDIAVADRGFANPPGVAHVHTSGADLLVRMNLVTLPLYDPSSSQRLDVLGCVRSLQPGQCGSWPVQVRHNKQRIAGRLCAVKKDEASNAKACARVRRESQRNGTTVQPQTLEAAGYVLVLTTLGEAFPAEQVMELYRARWQIELVFKRLKSLAQMGHLKKGDPRSARAWLQGKLLSALLIDALISSSENFSPWGCKRLSQDEGPLSVA